MKKIVGNILEMPFRLLDGFITPFLFPPQSFTHKEKFLHRVGGQQRRITQLEEEVVSLLASLQEKDLDERKLIDQLGKTEAEIDRRLKQIQDLETQLFQAWEKRF